MQTQTIDINGQTIAFHQSSGQGPAALLVHGNSSSGYSFSPQLDSPLGRAYRLVAIDLPGHGQSANANNPQEDYTLPGYARIITGVAKELGLENGVFVGWSLGGHILLEASGDLPNAAGFMIFGTPPIAFPPAMEQAFLPNPAMGGAFKEELTEDEADGFVRAFFKPHATEIPEAFWAEAKRTDGKARAVLGGSIAPNGYKDEVEIVANLRQPLAIVHGQEEQLINGAYIQSLSMPTLWRNEVQLIADAGHAPQWEQPEQFNALLEAFIKACTE